MKPETVPESVVRMKEKARVGERRRRLPLKWPFAKAVDELRREALARPDFDPAALFVWGQTMATGLLEMLKAVEAKFGMEGHQIARAALVETGARVAREMMDGIEWPEGLTGGEAASLIASWINEVVYASVEEARVESETQASFDILYCPHQSVYQPFDCRIQRYFVEGLIKGFREATPARFQDKIHFDAAFETTMPAGAPTCRFRVWQKPVADAEDDWNTYSAKLARKAVEGKKE